ncbi:hypothetical protein GCM10009727_57550 [Actinomadura napierensis]|uniref:Serpin domain-containing protein n=1 Tax=Actinomadura napierensis TaxID=267854 RepID=A0ABN3A1M0_9ACTN
MREHEAEVAVSAEVSCVDPHAVGGVKRQGLRNHHVFNDRTWPFAFFLRPRSRLVPVALNAQVGG